MQVEVEGLVDAQPLVLIHGLNSSSRQWYYQRLFFRRGYRLIIIDLPGHGRSPKPADLSVAVLAKDLSYVLNVLKVNRPILYGHSLGAMLVMQYCAEGMTPAVSAIILQHGSYIDPFRTTPYSPWMQLLKKPVLIPFLRLVQRHPLLFRIIGRLNYLNGLSVLFYRFLFFNGRQTPAQLLFMSRIAALNPPEVTAEGLLRCMEFDVSEKLKAIDLPALVLTAGYDRLINREAGAYISSQLTNGRLITINAGHQSVMEVPDEVNQAINTWMSALKNHSAGNRR
jgi:pimeloyl-ACP methyl ester carboxylesterase